MCINSITESDEQLILQMAARDEAALAELYRRYGPYLAALSRRMLGDSGDVQGCVQDAFVRLGKRPNVSTRRGRAPKRGS